MKKFVLLLAIVIVAGCQDDPALDDPKIDDPTIDDGIVLAEYQSIHRFEFGGGFGTITPFARDSVVLVREGKSEGTINILGHEVKLDQDGNYSCCDDDFSVSIKNDTLKASQKRHLNDNRGTWGFDTFIGVKDLKTPLKAGSVGFQSSAYEIHEGYNALYYGYNIGLEIKGAKYGATTVVEILNASTIKDYILIKSGTHIYSGPNDTIAYINIIIGDDMIPLPPRNIQFQISTESVGVTPAENKNFTLSIVDNEIAEPSVDKIMFTSIGEVVLTNQQLFDMNLDGTGRRQRTNFIGETFSPSFSPNGEEVVFLSTKADLLDTEIYTMDFKMGGEPRQITDNSRYEYCPTYSPDGNKILFIALVRTNPADHQIFSINLDGTNEKQLSHITINNGAGAVDIMDASWSPDGKQIVFTCNKDNGGFGYRMYIMNADGSNVRRLTNKNRSEQNPQFSPDGSKILFHANEEGGQPNLYLMNADGSNEIMLSFQNLPSSLFGQWSPDGSRIFFSDGVSGYYTARIDGTDVRFVTDRASNDARWSPAK